MKLIKAVGHDKFGPIYFRNDKNEPVCGAKKDYVEEGKRCMCPVRIAPTGRCRFHGGRGGKKNNDNTRAQGYGTFSKVLPDHLIDNYEKSLMDPDLGNMRDSIALMDAFIAQYLGGLLRMPPVESLEEAVTDLEIFSAEVQEEDLAPETLRLLKDSINKLKAVIKNRSEEQETRRAVRERAELVKVEAMRIDKASRYVTVEQAMALVSALIATVNKHVSTESERLLISRDIGRIVNKGTSERPRSGDSSSEGTEIVSAAS